MGVTNLTSFINSRPEFTIEHFELRDTRLIIDASNIKHRLHQCSLNENINVFGGNLTLFAKTLKIFLRCLQSANIRPIFVCDGAKDITVHDKTEEQLRRARNIFTSTRQVYDDRAGYASQVTSDNLSNVYISIISEFNMDIYSCMFEADAEIARLSNHHKAPILSHDSDFFLMDLENGIIGFSPRDFLNNNGRQFINCKLYRRNHFVRSFPGLDEQCLPLVGVLIGNDFVPEEKFHQLIYKHGDFVVSSDEQWSSCQERHEKMLKVLYFLTNKTPERAINRIIQIYDCDGETDEKVLKEYLTRNMQFYDIPTGDNHFEVAIAKIYQWANPEQVRRISDHLLNYLRFNTSDLLELLHKTCLFMRPIIDDFGIVESSRACSYQIHGVVLRLLRWTDNDNKPFSLYDRLGDDYCEHKIEPVIRLPNYGLIRMNIYDILTSTPKSCLRLLLATIYGDMLSYWDSSEIYKSWLTAENAAQANLIKLLLDYIDIMNPDNKSPERFKRAIFTTFLYYTHGRDQIYQRYGSYEFMYEIDKSYLKEPIYRADYCMIIMHWITRFAAVIQQFNMLNSLLNEPMPRMRIHNWFNAVLIYNLTLNTRESDRALHGYERAQLAYS